jgi:hypothetical protein
VEERVEKLSIRNCSDQFRWLQTDSMDLSPEAGARWNHFRDQSSEESEERRAAMKTKTNLKAGHRK